MCVRLKTVFFLQKKAMFLLHAVPKLRVKGIIVRDILTFYASIGRFNNFLESKSDFGIIHLIHTQNCPKNIYTYPQVRVCVSGEQKY